MNNILCIDVGGTRIKAAVLPRDLEFSKLKKIPLVAMRTLGWLNQSLPEILSDRNWASLVLRLPDAEFYDEIAIAVPGPVRNGRFFREDLLVPRELLKAFQEWTDKRVYLYEDAYAWAIGAMTLQSMQEKAIEFPALVLAFGTGVGCAVACGPEQFVSVELSEWPHGFSKLESTSKHPVSPAYQVHQILGKPFFEWVDRSHQEWTYDIIREEFSQRVASMVQDMTGPLADRSIRGHRIGSLRTLIVGGGNAEFVSQRMAATWTGLEVKLLCGTAIDFDGDLVPLAGLHRLVTNRSIRIRE